MNFRVWLLASVSVAALLQARFAVADALVSTPAVSAPNGKLGAFVGSSGGATTLGATGSWAVPLGQQWGAQIDGVLGTADSATFYGIGGHVFWRDPSQGLLGLTGSWVDWDKTTTLTFDPIGGEENVDTYRDITGAGVGSVGVEAEKYLGRISLEGSFGYQFGDRSGVRGRGTVAFYPTDDLRLDLGVSTLVGAGSTFRGGLEWAPAGQRFSLFANAAASADASSVAGGVKVFFGGAQKSLIRRHREDDPGNLLPDDLYTIVGDKYCPADVTLLNGFCDSNN